MVNDANPGGCRILGTVADNDFQDLRRKAARLGGNVARMTRPRTARAGISGTCTGATTRSDQPRCAARRRISHLRSSSSATRPTANGITNSHTRPEMGAVPNTALPHAV